MESIVPQGQLVGAQDIDRTDGEEANLRGWQVRVEANSSERIAADIVALETQVRYVTRRCIEMEQNARMADAQMRQYARMSERYRMMRDELEKERNMWQTSAGHHQAECIQLGASYQAAMSLLASYVDGDPLTEAAARAVEAWRAEGRVK